MTVSIRQATVADADLVAPLFDAYRQFYRQPADLPRARRFLAERLSQHQSSVLVAEAAGGEAVGFVQLYPCFSSIRVAPVFILSDLFVAPTARGGGVGRLPLRQPLGEEAAGPREVGWLPIELPVGIEQRRDEIDVGHGRLADRDRHRGLPSRVQVAISVGPPFASARW